MNLNELPFRWKQLRDEKNKETNGERNKLSKRKQKEIELNSIPLKVNQKALQSEGDLINEVFIWKEKMSVSSYICSVINTLIINSLYYYRRNSKKNKTIVVIISKM